MHGLPVEVHELIRLQRGVIAPRQLLASGLSTSQIRHLVRRRQLIRYPGLTGVYRSPSTPDDEAARSTAVCLARAGAVLSGPTAGRFWGFRRLPKDLRVHVFVPRRAARPTAPWIVAHRSATLPHRSIGHDRHGLVVLSRLETVVDLAPNLCFTDLTSVLAQAMSDGQLAREAVARELDRLRTLRVIGATTTIEALDTLVAGGPAESHAEIQVIAALRAAGVTGLVGQHETVLPGVGRVRFDIAVPDARWAVEVDLHPSHFDSAGAARDARRDRAARRAGWLIRRVVAAELTSLPRLADRLRLELDRRRLDVAV